MRPIPMLFAALFALAMAAAPALAEMPDPMPTLEDTAPAPDNAAGVDDATVLAFGQVLVSETNWRRTPDASAIAEVLRSRQLARGDASLLETMHAYCPRATGQAPSSLIRMRWISTLRLDAGEPAGWRALNRHRALRGDLPLPWSNFEERWRARLVEARDLLESPQPSACEAPPQHWGAQSLDRTAIGWSEIRCGATINRFWRLPARSSPRAVGARSGPISRG